MRSDRPGRTSELDPNADLPARPDCVEDVEHHPAALYIRDNFRPTDRLALVTINKRSGAVVQRLMPAENIARGDTLRWLEHMNRSNYEVYVSMNALREDAHGRTREDVGEIRHVYLDLDRDGEAVLQRLRERADLPKPNYVLQTSPGKYQVVWKVEGFSPEQAEELQRGLAREMGADIAVTDSSRVLRLPGFYNHKYERSHLVEATRLSEQVFCPEHFPEPQTPAQEDETAQRGNDTTVLARRYPGNRLSQSERDWAYAKRALARGDPKEAVIAAIAEYRKNDKPRPKDYARLTVEKASRALESEHQSPQLQQPAPPR